MADRKPAAKPAEVKKPAQPAPHVLRSREHGTKFYVILQGDVVEMHELTAPPDLTTKPGERRKQVIIATHDKDKAQARFDRTAARARGVVGKGQAY